MFSLTVKKNEDKTHIRLTGVVPVSAIERHRATVLDRLRKTTKIDGFRDGTAPDDLVEKTVGDLEVWRQCGVVAITDAFPSLIAESGFTPVSQPSLQLTAVPIRGDISFSVDFFTVPAIDLPDYRAALASCGAKKEPTDVTDDEVDAVLLDVRKGLFRDAHPEKSIPTDDGDLPALTDERIASLSGTCKDVASFRKKIREEIAGEKRREAKRVHRERLLTAIMESLGDIAVPEIMIEEGAKESREEFALQAERLGTTIERYCETENITEDSLRKSFKDQARQRSKTQILLNAIREKENINPSRESVDKEVDRYKKRVGGGDEEKVRVYIETTLANEAVLQHLESLAAGVVK